MKRNLFRNALGSLATPWPAPRFLCYAGLAIVLPVVGFVLGGAGVAKACGRKKLQGLVLFVTANASALAYGALFAAIVSRVISQE